jgi:hypothetical protein
MRHGEGLSPLFAQMATEQAETEVFNFLVIAIMGALVILPTIFLVVLVLINRRHGGDDGPE